jgi:hypothetical protein
VIPPLGEPATAAQETVAGNERETGDEPRETPSHVDGIRESLGDGPGRRHPAELAVKPATSLVADQARISAIAKSVRLDDEGGDVDGGTDAGR